jgi:phosphatidylglycerophosphate synthase
MSKLSKESKFLDFSDYGRPIASYFALKLKNTLVTPIHLTLLFGCCGLLAAYFILIEYYWWAAIFLVIKSIIDAMDGELSRVKSSPSYTGRYLDSIFDILLNLLFVGVIAFKTSSPPILGFFAFVSIQLQGTLYNFYYVILRNKTEGGDTTSQIFENKVPAAFPGESQYMVNFMYLVYRFFYGILDKAIYLVDSSAAKNAYLPNWFMSILSFYGLGFQLFLIGLMLVLGYIGYIIPFFIGFSILGVLLVFTRKIILKS